MASYVVARARSTGSILTIVVLANDNYDCHQLLFEKTPAVQLIRTGRSTSTGISTRGTGMTQLSLPV
eukprot:CAMPEP_0119017212 /NCGR_PEP_ID=MMETSP1176-20130426/15773_1 /TAXON_ID=265551 /ORGANISM="Synedropsis recta cf, Strain CCMP1620" /LENGTH=66 /DNA_ID=CAMNT_0006970867 /DNA_START=1 /DNA_END=198 /DNA_ORIENTATION=+